MSCRVCPPTSFSVLEGKEPLHGPLFLEASAGTGKTFAIEHTAVRLICENKIPLEEILIVTFTRAAARELKERIRHNIEAALLQLRSQKIEFPYLKTLDREAPYRLEQSLLISDRAPIYTIHSFCHRALTEFAFEARASLALSDPDLKEGTPKLIEEIYNFLRIELTEDLIAPSQLKLILKQCGRCMERLALRLLDLAGKQVAPARPFSEIRTDFEHLSPKGRDLKEEFCAFAGRFKELCDRLKNPKQVWIDQVEAIEKGDLAALIGEENLFSKLVPENLKAKQAYDIPEHWREMMDTLSPLIEEASGVAHLMALLASRVRERLTKVKEALDLATPDDLLAQMKRAVQYQAFGDALRSQYRAVIIDEFQDTDQDQWDIFKSLFLHASIEVFMLVGDPKQSIYAFRGADLSVYFAAGETLGEGAHRSLDTNYRSDPALIEALNALFAPPDQGNWLIEGAFHPVKAGKTERVPNAGLHIVVALGSRHPRAAWPTKEMEESQLFPFILNEIIDKGYALKDVAILIKDRFQAYRLESFLIEHSIPVLSKGVKPLKETLAFSWICELFEALTHLNQNSHIKRFLGHALMPYTIADLYDKQENLLAPMAHLYRLAHTLSHEGLALFFQALFECDWLGSGEAFYQGLDLQDYGDLMRISEIVIEEGELERAIETIKESHIDIFPRYKRVGLSDADAVTIMTMHMSKGLEFPVVFALGCASRYKGSDEERTTAEEMRGLYVALTRAKYKLYVPIALEIDKEPVHPSPAEIFFSHWATPLTADNLDSALSSLIATHAITLDRLEGAQTPKSFEKKRDYERTLHPFDCIIASQSLSSFTALARSETAVKEWEFRPDDLPMGAHTGVQLHALFETIIAHNLYGKSRLDQLIAEVFPDHSPLVKAIVESAFERELLPGLRLADIPPGDLCVELELLYEWDPSLCIKGFVDLVFKWKDQLYVLDWKSNYLGYRREDYDEASLHQVMHSHDYYFQGALYSEALKRFMNAHDPAHFDRSFGGVIYLFLRGLPLGSGVIHFKPDLTHLNKEIHERLP